MIEVNNLVKRYGNHTAVDHLSFKIEKGKIYGFLGPNGAGKSTTMNMITGYIASTEGTVKIDGHDILEEPEAAKKCIGYLPEQPPVYFDMTVLEYMKFVADLKKIPKDKKANMIEEVMDMVKISDMRNRLIKNLSKGYRQRVGLAEAIMGYPEVIILDEPTVGLDPKQIIEIRTLIKELKKKHTVILSSHILSEVSAVCDYVLIISHGKLVASDTPENLGKLAEGSNTLEMLIKGEKTQIRQGGYYLYYEKNPGMQTYMIDKNEELQPEPQEKYEDQAVKDFRKIIADKKETRKEPAAPSVFSYGLTACLAIAVLTVGVNFYRSYQNVKQNEKESATVSSVIVEEITPSPVVGTSNNEAVRRHKQYRTDTIQNDAGKNKKNNEENDEENNQSTSEKENSEKKNNTSEKKISAEQTDTEQKSDKTEQLSDVKTEKADKTEQIYQQEADERKAQKRVREAVQKENSEAAGKAHESYVIQPGDTLFQISMDRYGSIEAISQICKLNGMSADEIIYPGQVIVLP